MSAAGDSTVEGFDRVFDFVGGHGKFQWILLLILSLQRIVLTWHHISYAFLGAVPDHWCLIPELSESNWTLDQQKLISIPQETEIHLSSSELKFKTCEYYNLNYVNLMSSSNSFDEAYEQVDWNNVTTRECSRWNYDHSIYHSTLATDFDLVCGNRWMVATIQGSYMAGGLIGTLMFGTLSDRFLGRRKTVLISLSMVVIGGILASFSSSYWMFLFFRFIISLGVSGSMQNCFVLITEHSDKKYRAMLAIVEQLPFAIGYMLLPGLAFYLRDWDKLQLSFGIISTVLVVYFWILPDSPRWLATHGYTDKAMDAINKIAKVNGHPSPNQKDLEEILKQCYNENERNQKQLEIQQHQLNNSDDIPPDTSSCKITKVIGKVRKWLLVVLRSFKKLIKTTEIRRRSLVFWSIFLIVAMIYYGIVFAGNITDDPYLLVLLGGAAEVPAYTVIVPIVTKLGRKPTTVGNFILTGIMMLALSQTPEEYEAVRITLAMLAKLFVSTCFAIIYLLGAELYPTELRTTGLAVGIFCGRIGAVAAPYIVDLMQNISTDLPTIIFGSLAIGGGLVTLLLPETKTWEMSDMVAQIELQVEEEVKKAKVEEKRRESLATSVDSGGTHLIKNI